MPQPQRDTTLQQRQFALVMTRSIVFGLLKSESHGLSILLGFFALFFLSFVAPSHCVAQAAGRMTEPPQKRHRKADTVAVVDGTVLRYGEFKEQLNQLITKRARGNSMNDSEYTRCVNDIWEAMTTEIFIREEVKARHLTFRDAEVLKRLHTNPPVNIKMGFRDSSGRFERERFSDLLKDTSSAFTKQIVLLCRTEMEDEAIRAKLCAGAKTEAARKQILATWWKKQLKYCKLEDRRAAFGLY